jgi:hypothetical protein
MFCYLNISPKRQHTKFIQIASKRVYFFWFYNKSSSLQVIFFINTTYYYLANIFIKIFNQSTTKLSPVFQKFFDRIY